MPRRRSCWSATRTTWSSSTSVPSRSTARPRGGCPPDPGRLGQAGRRGGGGPESEHQPIHPADAGEGDGHQRDRRAQPDDRRLRAAQVSRALSRKQFRGRPAAPSAKKVRPPRGRRVPGRQPNAGRPRAFGALPPRGAGRPCELGRASGNGAKEAEPPAPAGLPGSKFADCCHQCCHALCGRRFPGPRFSIKPPRQEFRQTPNSACCRVG
jgi:hypothetical protein